MADQDQEKDKKPAIPAFGGLPKPQLKIKGLASSGMSLLERLKAFKKKDLAFVLAGMGVLFMAPLAEHFLMSPESADTGAFKEGWGFRGGTDFGRGGSPYEGSSGFAPGSPIGAGSDIITPLNVRDPSALVMGPGATQQPPATSSTPAAPPKETSDWKDALAGAAKRGAKEAVKQASLPVPKVPLANAGLRGLGAASGGGGGSYTLPAISASNVPNTAAGSNSLANVRPISGYRGAAGARGAQSGGRGGLEDLKKAAGQQASDFSRSGPAASALEQAASRAMPTGDSDGGIGPGKGGDDKAAAQSQDKGSKSTGESLEFLRQKQIQDKELELFFKKREKAEMMWPNLKEKITEEFVMTGIAKPLAGSIADMFKSIGKETPAKFTCKDGPLEKKVPECAGKDSKNPCRDASGAVFIVDPDGKFTPHPTIRCFKAGEDAPADKAAEAAIGALDAPAGSYAAASVALGAICDRYNQANDTSHKQISQAMQDVLDVNWAMTGGAGSLANCGAGTSRNILAAGPAMTQDNLRLLLQKANDNIHNQSQAASSIAKVLQESLDAAKQVLDQIPDPAAQGGAGVPSPGAPSGAGIPPAPAPGAAAGPAGGSQVDLNGTLDTLVKLKGPPNPQGITIKGTRDLYVTADAVIKESDKRLEAAKQSLADMKKEAGTKVGQGPAEARAMIEKSLQDMDAIEAQRNISAEKLKTLKPVHSEINVLLNNLDSDVDLASVTKIKKFVSNTKELAESVTTSKTAGKRPPMTKEQLMEQYETLNTKDLNNLQYRIGHNRLTLSSL